MDYKCIDFSSKHHILIRNLDGTFSPMDYPFYQAKYLGAGVWQILSDGDYIYLVEGEKEALVIDTGYACGNIRKFCQGLTDKPIWRVANTHEHFDHTANNFQFDKAYMSAYTAERASIPMPGPDFEGLSFPRDYPIEIIQEGYEFDLGDRTLQVFELPGHSEGSLAFLDAKGGFLFAGDEFVSRFKILHTSVERFAKQMEKLYAYRDKFHTVCAGNMICSAEYVERYLANARYILEGHEGKLLDAWPTPEWTEDENVGLDDLVFDRQMPRRTKRERMRTPDYSDMRVMEYAGSKIIYNRFKIFATEQEGVPAEK